MRTRRPHSRGGGALTATVLAAAALAVPVLAVTVQSAPAGAGARPNALPDNQPPVPAGNPSTVFAKDGPYKAGVAFETTAVGDTVVVTYPVDLAAAVGKPTYTVNLLRWFTGSPTAPVPAGLPQNLPTTLSTDAYQGVPTSNAGPFPVVMFSHGYGGYPEQSSFLTDHLATWGFVVVAPDHRSRDLKAVLSGTTGQGQDDVTDLRQALDLARAMNAAPHDLLSGKLDLHRVASLGHSATRPEAPPPSHSPATPTCAPTSALHRPQGPRRRPNRG